MQTTILVCIVALSIYDLVHQAQPLFILEVSAGLHRWSDYHLSQRSAETNWISYTPSGIHLLITLYWIWKLSNLDYHKPVLQTGVKY